MPTKKAQQKRGVKGYFVGSRLEFLNSRLSEYVSLRGKCRNRFWGALYEAWWQKYPWRLPDDVEPPSNDPGRMMELARTGSGDVEEKKKVEIKLRKRITTWFTYRASVHNSIRGREAGVWLPLLKRIHQQNNPKPRCRSVAQQLMFEDPKAVDDAFHVVYGIGEGMTPATRMNKRNEIAKDLVFGPLSDRAEDLQKRAKEIHERELREWGLELDSIEEATDIHEARDSLVSAVHPLLKLIGGYSGCYITLLAAAPDGSDGYPYFSAAHHIPQDITNRLNWTGFDEQGFNNGVVRPFFDYIRWMEGTEDGMSQDTESASEAEPILTPQASSAASSKAVAKTTSTLQPPGRYRKRALSETLSSDMGATSEEDEDEDEGGLDSDDLADHGSSGSSVDSNHAPAKRLRTSMATRSSTATPVPEESAGETDVRLAAEETDVRHAAGETAVRHAPPSATGDRDPNTEPIPPTPPSHSQPEPMDMDTDEPNTGAGVSDPARVVYCARKPTEKPPATPSQSSLPSPSPKLPEFLLIEKYNVYKYLSSIKEANFQKLLEAYVTFECADRSRIDGALATLRRPRAISWWTSRARPHKVPPYDSLRSFTEGIINWWIYLQPEWRKIDVGVVSRVGGGFDDWECLYQPRMNGLLNVVILAHWWARILVERDNTVDGVYSWFVSDVSWVLSQLTIVAPDAHD